MTTRDPNDLPPEGGEPTRYFPDPNPYEVPPTTPLPSDPTRVNPAVGGLPPLPPAAPYQPTQATPVPPTTQLPPTGPYGGGTPPPPAGGPPWVRAPLPWILGGVAALLLLALLVLFVTQSNNGGGGTPTPTVAAATPSDTPVPPTETVAVVIPPTLEPAATVPAETATPAPPSETPLPVPATVTAVPVPPTLPPPTPVPPTPLPPTPLPPTPLPPTPLPPTPEPPTLVPPTLVPPTPLPPTPLPPTPLPPTFAPTRTAAPETVVPATVIVPPPPGSPQPTPGTMSTPGATPVPATPPPAVAGSLTVQWFGQSGVLLITPDGNTILVDPPAPATGYQMPFLGRVAALLVSRDEADYNYVAAAQTDNLLVAARNGQFIPVDAQLSDARIQAIQSQGMSGQPTPNGIWVVDSPGLYMVHLGGLKGPLPRSPQLRPQPDVLFLPVGGGSVLDAAAAVEIVNQLKPHVVIPLHYKTADSRLPLASVDEFLAAGYRDVIRPGHTWTVKPTDLKGTDAAQPRIVVLDYK